MKTIALIGPTASGKSDLAIVCAKEVGARILSLDSLSIYKEIDIASAKPTLQERAGIIHYGIDLLYPENPFNVVTFIDLYQQARFECEAAGVPLIIVGGTSFYLKALMDGISETPKTDVQTREKVDAMMHDHPSAYALLRSVDPVTMKKIASNDRYRTEKMLTLYLQTGIAPSVWFASHPPRPLLTDCELFEIDVASDLLRKRIAKRTHKMLISGLIDEVAGLERRYGRAPGAMKAIGIVEVLDYLDGKTDAQQMIERIITHTAQLAKRQQTFNRNQFGTKTHMPLDNLYDLVRQSLACTA